MAGLCERCVTREARSPHDLYCDQCETPDQPAAAPPARITTHPYASATPDDGHSIPGGFCERVVGYYEDGQPDYCGEPRSAHVLPAREPRCPQCAGPLVAVLYSGGYLNRDQWEAQRAGDWYCRTCPPNGRSKRDLWCYWWDREVQPAGAPPASGAADDEGYIAWAASHHHVDEATVRLWLTHGTEVAALRQQVERAEAALRHIDDVVTRVLRRAERYGWYPESDLAQTIQTETSAALAAPEGDDHA